VITPQKAIDSINAQYGRHEGSRALHAKGFVCQATFTANERGKALTRAAHMQGEPVDATVRFSNGSGDPKVADWVPGVRGLAVKLYLPDGSRTDIVAQTVPRFPVSTPDEFMELMAAAAPGRARPLRLLGFLARHPKCAAPLRANADSLKPPASYAARDYNAVHAYRWTGADGESRWVRYRLRSRAPATDLAVSAARERGDDYLEQEFVERLQDHPVEFALEVQIADAGDPTDDPIKAWPADRETLDVGTLAVTGLDTEREQGDDILVFDPGRVTDGIEPSEDPVLAFRPRAYSESVLRRSGAQPPERTSD
jgi:catalase